MFESEPHNRRYFTFSTPSSKADVRSRRLVPTPHERGRQDSGDPPDRRPEVGRRIVGHPNKDDDREVRDVRPGSVLSDVD